MSDNLILDYPVLRNDSGDFSAEISYDVEASRSGKNLEIKHRLNGQSFISQLVDNGKAEFSVLLLYRDSSERQNYSCRVSGRKGDEIVAAQTVPIKFSYAPEIMPSIVLLEDKTILVDGSSGLTDFWKRDESFKIPRYSRIALGQKLRFTSGDISNLMRVEHNKNLQYGEMKVEVFGSAGEGDTPVTLVCGEGVYNQLRKITQAEPSNAVASMRSAIVTKALCAVYAEMQNLSKDENYEVGGVLKAHLEMLENKTRENWEYQNFSPSLVATKMRPYFVDPKILRDEDDDD